MRFDQPVGSTSERNSSAWAGGWVDAAPIGTYYLNPATRLYAYHTGADLNLNTPFWDADAHAEVFASADGVVVHARKRAVWGNLIVIKHDVDGETIFTRYGHVEQMFVEIGHDVKRGDLIARVGNADGTLPYHLHFDVARADLEKTPGDWPGTDLTKLRRDYIDPKAWINEHRKDNMKKVVKDMDGDSLFVRAMPSSLLTSTKIGYLRAGESVDVVAEDGEWSNIQLLKTPLGSSVKGWVKSSFLQNPAVNIIAPVISQPKAKIGINALNRHEEVCYPAAQAGCRFFLILNNPGFASALKDKYPDATVMVRRHWERQMPSVDSALARLDGCRDPRLIYTGVNEGDEVGQGTVEQIRQRAEFDLALARRIKEISGATYAAGTFSMGTPDFTKPQICSAIRALYAPAYNAGQIWWDHHLYSPRLDHIYQDGELQWYETRWQFLFTRCGFNPASVSRVLCSETGEDEGGVGGFPVHGRSGDDVAAWCRRFIEVQGRPLVVDGVSHPSPFLGGALFQAGNREDWMGYNVERYYDNLSGVWNS